jgi:hypothetical protein
MRRFFITQHPTFGSYANPISSKIEKSVLSDKLDVPLVVP